MSAALDQGQSSTRYETAWCAAHTEDRSDGSVGHKFDPVIETVKLVHTNQEYARLRMLIDVNPVFLRRHPPRAEREIKELDHASEDKEDAGPGSADEELSQPRHSGRLRNPPQRYDPSCYS